MDFQKNLESIHLFIYLFVTYLSSYWENWWSSSRQSWQLQDLQRDLSMPHQPMMMPWNRNSCMIILKMGLTNCKGEEFGVLQLHSRNYTWNLWNLRVEKNKVESWGLPSFIQGTINEKVKIWGLPSFIQFSIPDFHESQEPKKKGGNFIVTGDTVALQIDVYTIQSQYCKKANLIFCSTDITYY